MIRLAPLLMALLALCVPAWALDRVTIGANWLAEAEHGGFYQAIADGTYARYRLDVTILPGGPQKNNRLLLAAGKIDFYMGDNLIGEFSAVVEVEGPAVEGAGVHLLGVLLEVPISDAQDFW